MKGTDGFHDSTTVEATDYSEKFLMDSARREVREELGIEPLDGEVVGKTVFEDDGFKYTTFIVAVSPAEKAKLHEECKPSQEVDGADWFTLDNLPKPLHFGLEYTMQECDLADVLADDSGKTENVSEDVDAIAKAAREWDESEHPRDAHGEFVESADERHLAGMGVTDPTQRAYWAGRVTDGPPEKVWVITSKPKFKLDPNRAATHNYTSVTDVPDMKGVYVTNNPEHWWNGRSRYRRPFIAEITVNGKVPWENVPQGSQQAFINGVDFDKLNVDRVLPVDEWVRETYGEHGWVESYNGTTVDGKVIAGNEMRPFPKGYKYTGADVRDMTADQVKELNRRFAKYHRVNKSIDSDTVAKAAAAWDASQHPRGEAGKFIKATGADEEDLATHVALDWLKSAEQIAGRGESPMKLSDEVNIPGRIAGYMEDDGGKLSRHGDKRWSDAAIERVKNLAVATAKQYIHAFPEKYPNIIRHFSRAVEKVDETPRLSDEEVLRKFVESEPRDKDGKWTADGNKTSVTVQTPVLSPERIEELKKDTTVFWHGTASGSLQGGTLGLHVGTHEAAKEALEATIGHRADGKDWDGTQEYGKTLLAGTDTLKKLGPYLECGFNCGGTGVKFPKSDFYPSDYKSDHATFSNGEKIPLTVKPTIFPVRITGQMTNTNTSPMSDDRANSTMKRQMKLGNAKRGYYYRNEGEDSGSISAVVPPGGKHLEIITKSADGVVELVGILKAVEEPMTDFCAGSAESPVAKFAPAEPRDSQGRWVNREAVALSEKADTASSVAAIEGTPEAHAAAYAEHLMAENLHGVARREAVEHGDLQAAAYHGSQAAHHESESRRHGDRVRELEHMLPDTSVFKTDQELIEKAAGEWDASLHPRGQPGNKGEFAAAASGVNPDAARFDGVGIEGFKEAIARDKVETVGVFTKDGQLVFTSTDNKTHSVSFSDEQYKQLAGCVIIHNHPSGITGLAVADVHTMIDSNASEVVTVTPSYEFSMSNKTGVKVSIPDLRKKYDALYKQEYNRIRRGKGDVFFGPSDHAWNTIADKYGLTYERTRRETPASSLSKSDEEIIRKYSESEARDEHGRWTDEGGAVGPEGTPKETANPWSAIAAARDGRTKEREAYVEFCGKMDKEQPGWRRPGKPDIDENMGAAFDKYENFKTWYGLRKDAEKSERQLTRPADIRRYAGVSQLRHDLENRVRVGKMGAEEATKLESDWRDANKERLDARKQQQAQHAVDADSSAQAAVAHAAEKYGFKPAATVDEANAVLKGFGITGEYKRTQLGVGNATNAALTVAHANGDPLPKKLDVIASSAVKYGARFHVTKFNDGHFETALTVNSSKAHQASWTKQVATGWWSQANPILHELGHAFHQGHDPVGYYRSCTQPSFMARVLGHANESVSSKVSKYATSSAAEFVAETYAGLRSGKMYDADVMDLFTKETTPKAPK